MNLGSFALCAAACLVALPAFADDKAACLDASGQAQTLRDAHKLLASREQLRACARDSCPAIVRRDCIAWLTDLERLLPTVVLSLKDAEGRDLVAASVTMDGTPFADSLTGTAVPVDPGPHTFRFTLATRAVVEQQVLVGEGQRELAVAARFAPAGTQPLSSERLGSEASTSRTVGWVLGGVGVAGLAVGGIFGGIATADRGNAGCTNDRCTNFAEVTHAKTAADVADVGLIAGGVLAATGAALVVFSHGRQKATTAWVTLAPSAGGLVVRGGF